MQFQVAFFLKLAEFAHDKDTFNPQREEELSNVWDTSIHLHFNWYFGCHFQARRRKFNFSSCDFH